MALYQQYFKLTWQNGKTEIVRGRDFPTAFYDAGYGKASEKLLKSKEDASATDAEVLVYMGMVQKSGGSIPVWDRISDEGKLQWRAKATEHKWHNTQALPAKFPTVR